MNSRILDSGKPLLVVAAILSLCSNGLAKDVASDQVTVTIDSFQFHPDKVSVRKGGAVTFINHDAAPHTVSPASGANFAGTGRLLKGESKTVQFDVEGSQEYSCDFHPSMKGKVVVVGK
jgi:plastocyanin